MKRISKIIVLLCVMVAALACFAACSSSSVTGLSINTNEMQLTYVKGQELDLSGGVLVLTTNDGTDTISLSSDGVTITGYDSQTMGSQTITVEYGGKSVTFKVNVVNRMTVAGISSEYFVGDEFNKDKGLLRIYRDNGEYFDVDMSDDTVSVANFDSSEAGEREVTLTYKSDTEEYTGTITVTVYDVAEIKITKPNKTTYKSHETEIDLSGGNITVSNSDGSYSKKMSLTEDMISGFDLSEATYENSRYTEYEQTLTITYGNKTASFKIYIQFSNVSVVQLAAETLSSLDWSSSIPELTEEEGALAIDAISLFDTLSSDDKTYISDDVYLVIARVAAVYGLSEITEKLLTYRNVILYDEDSGGIDFITCGLEDSRADYEVYSEETLANITTQLVYIYENYGDENIYGTTTFADYLEIIPEYSTSVELLEFVLSLYDIFASAIPSDWSLDNQAENYIGNYSSTISLVYSNIVYGDYFAIQYRSAYSLLAEWREDFFTIMYDFWAIEGDATAIENISIIFLPYPFDEIDELTSSLYYLVYELYTYYYYAYYGYAYACDASSFMYYYNEYLNLVESVASSADSVTKIIYDSLSIYVKTSDGDDPDDESDDVYSYSTISGWMELFTYSSYSYYGRTYFYTGVDEVDDLWNDYFEILSMYIESLSEADASAEAFNENAYISSFVTGEAGTYIAAMFKKFVELTPTQQYSFLRSVNFNYASGAPVLGLSMDGVTDSTATIYSMFAKFIGFYYYNCLSENEFTLFSDLLTALEYYARQNDFSSNYGMQYFIRYMKTSVTLYNELDGTDEDGNILIDAPGVDNFNKYLNFLYTKYTAIYAMYDSNGNYTALTTDDLGEWEESFTELETIISEVYYVYSTYISNDYCYTALYSAFESAEILANNILQNASADVINAYYYMPVSITLGSSTLSWTLDYALSYVRQIYGSYMSVTTINSATLKNVYKASGLKTFMPNLNYLYRIYLDYNTTAYNTYDAQKVLSIMADFRSLTAEQSYLFLQMDTIRLNTGSTMQYLNSLYYEALNDFFVENLSADAAAVAELLLRAEFSYVDYAYNPTGINSEGYSTSYTFKQNMVSVLSAYTALSATEKTAFDSMLLDTYNYYSAAYEAM